MTYVTWREAQKPFSNSVIRASQDHAASVFPNESVGIVVNDEYVALENTHENPENHFRIAPEVLVEYEGQIQSVIHSHNVDKHPGHPSEADIATQMQWNIPFGIQLINSQGPGNIIWYGDQLPTAELLARPYVFGVYDCFSIWRDYYRIELGISLPNIPRDENFYLNGQNLYVNNAKSFGFEQVDNDDLQENDIILLRIRSKEIPNHGVVFLGGDQGLHHMPYKASARESVNRYIRKESPMFHSVWRYTK